MGFFLRLVEVVVFTVVTTAVVIVTTKIVEGIVNDER